MIINDKKDYNASNMFMGNANNLTTNNKNILLNNKNEKKLYKVVI